MSAPLSLVPSDGRARCERCAGCGQVASSEDGEPWTFWAELPPGADIAVRLGIVRPLMCMECSGTGLKEPTREDLDKVVRAAIQGAAR